MPMMIAIGHPHPELVGKRNLAEGAVLEITPDDFSIYAILDRPTPHEVKECQTGRIRIGLVPAGDHTFLLIMRSGTLNWTDMPFTLGDDRDVLPPREPDTGYLVRYQLCDLTTRVCCALRMFTITPAFCTLLERQIDKLRRNLSSFTRDKHLAEIAAFYRRYPSQNHVVEAAMIVETGGMKFPR